MADTTRRRIETEAVHGGELHDPSGSHIPPIHQTSTFIFDNLKQVADWATGETDGYIYSRGGNPTRKALANKIATLEGFGLDTARVTPGAEIFGSGMAAISAALMGVAKSGDHVIAQQVLYGSADYLISDVLPEYGITSSRVPLLAPDALEAELEAYPNTKVVYLETPANPTMSLIDIRTTSDLAHAAGAIVIADNTFATPIVQRPLELGADVVVHSTTKYINGHGTVIGGAVVALDDGFIEEAVAPLIRFMGGVPSPFDCWLTNIGLKTLPLRMGQHCANAATVADFLDDHPMVAETHYPGLASHPRHELAREQMDGFGAMIAFDVGSTDAAAEFIDRLDLCTLAVSLGNVDTLIEHPATMTHRVVDPQDRAAAGITDGLLRISIGLEAADDIIADLDQALAN